MTCNHSSHTDCIKDALAFAEKHCTAKGLRFTDMRQKVFSLLWKSHKAMTAADIMAVVGKSQPPLTYRALEFLKDQKLIHHIASLNAYIGCTRPDTPHAGQLMICSACRDVTELKNDALYDDLKIVAQTSHFAIQQAFIEVVGLCAQCNKSSA